MLLDIMGSPVHLEKTVMNSARKQKNLYHWMVTRAEANQFRWWTISWSKESLRLTC
jgi:hypothetical protein